MEKEGAPLKKKGEISKRGRPHKKEWKRNGAKIIHPRIELSRKLEGGVPPFSKDPNLGSLGNKE